MSGPGPDHRAGPDARLEGPDIVIRPDADAVAVEAARRIVEGLRSAVDARGIAHWATTGGSSPAGIYRALVAEPLRSAVDWSRVHLWWGDDRFESRTDRLSNVRSADAILLAPDGVPIPAAAVHPWPCDEALERGHGPGWAAERYAAEAAAVVPTGPDGVPTFDVVLLGIGPDGHLLSVFPGSAAFETRAAALAVPAPTHIEPRVPRVTFGPAMLDAARMLIAVATGAAKASVIAAILGPERDERRWPAQRARRAGAVWVLDEAAAAGLPGR